jgi:hypothetical protein
VGDGFGYCGDFLLTTATQPFMAINFVDEIIR